MPGLSHSIKSPRDSGLFHPPLILRKLTLYGQGVDQRRIEHFLNYTPAVFAQTVANLVEAVQTVCLCFHFEIKMWL